MRTINKYSLLLWSLSLLLFSCNEKELPKPIMPDAETIQAKRNITGFILYADAYDPAQPPKPLSNTTIIIRNSAYPNPAYQETITTDKDGFFFVTVPDSAASYKIIVSADVASHPDTTIHYTGEILLTPATANDERAILQPAKTIPALLSVIATDELTGRIPGATVLLYTSRVLAQLDSNMTGFGKYDQKSTTDKGVALFKNIPADSVFIRAYLRINDSTILKNDITAYKPVGTNATASVTLK